MSSKPGDELIKSRVPVFFLNTYKLHIHTKLENSWYSVYYSETISFNYEMIWIRHHNETTSYTYEMKFIRFHIFMKKCTALLKNKILLTSGPMRGLEKTRIRWHRRT